MTVATLSPTDQIRLRNRHHQTGAGIPTPIAAIPDQELIDTLVAHGQPRWSAVALKRNPALRLAALRFWCDVGDAGRGDPVANERVDYCRACWSRMRAEELITDDPRRGHHGSGVGDPKDLL